MNAISDFFLFPFYFFLLPEKSSGWLKFKTCEAQTQMALIHLSTFFFHFLNIKLAGESIIYKNITK